MLVDLYKNDELEMVDAFGVEYPREFTDRDKEYDALVTTAGIMDLTHRCVLEIAGEDRASFLNAMLTNDIVSLKDGEGCHALMTTVKGKIISELFILAGNERHLAIVAQGDFAETLSVLDKHLISEDVTITDISDAFGIIALEGPRAGAVLQRVLRAGPIPKEPLDWVSREIDDFRITVVKATATGEPGFHLIIPALHVARIRGYFIQAARGSDGLAVGHDAWDTRRIENGLPWHGIDFTEDNFPQEVRLDHAVSYEKGCFRGQETLARIHHRGNVNRVLVGLVPCSGTSDPEPGSLPEARMTCMVQSIQLASVLAMGFVPKESGDPGSEVALEVSGGPARMKVIELPLPANNSDGG